MSAAVSLSERQRATGHLRLAVRRRGDLTSLADLRQEGCLKARFPRPAAWMEAILLNTSGGIAGGDELRSEIVVAEGAAATFASQAAERFYRALPEEGPAHVRTSIRVAARGAAEWLPQESILFNGSALVRRLEIDVAADAWFLGVESLVFGRTAMGEEVRAARLADTIRLSRDGELLLHDAIRLEGDVAAQLDRPTVANGGRAIATLVHVSPDAADRLDALRAAFADVPAEAAASAWRGMLVGRIVATDGARLRAAVIAGLAVLRTGRPLPRVWQC